MTSSRSIDLFPLGVVLFPQGLLRLKVFEQRYVEMTKRCLRDNTEFGVCLIAQGHEVGQPAEPFTVGCTARITEWDMPQPGLFQLQAQGGQTFRIEQRWVEGSGLMQAKITLLEAPEAIALPEQHRPLAAMLTRLIKRLGEEHFHSPTQLDDAAWVAYRLLEALPLPLPIKQHWLERNDALAILDELSHWLGEQPANTLQ